jgi:hypothetical protein
VLTPAGRWNDPNIQKEKMKKKIQYQQVNPKGLDIFCFNLTCNFFSSFVYQHDHSTYHFLPMLSISSLQEKRRRFWQFTLSANKKDFGNLLSAYILMKWMRDKGCQSLVVGSDVPSFIYLCQ